MDLLITCFNFSYVMVCPFLIFFWGLVLSGACLIAGHCLEAAMHTFSGAPARTEPGCHGTRTPGTLRTQPATSRAREERLGPKEKQPHGEWLGTGGFNPRWVPNVHCRWVAHGLWNDPPPQKKKKLCQSKTHSKILNSNSPNVTNLKLSKSWGSYCNCPC